MRGIKSRWLIAVIAFLGGVLSAVLIYNILPFFQKPPERPVARLIPPVEVPPIKPPELPPAPEVPAVYPRVAIVIDDMGEDLRSMDKLFEVDAPITVAVIPHLKYSRKVAQEAHERMGWEVIAHIPMEPKGFAEGNGKNPGRGALLTNMSGVQVKRLVREGLQDVPYASGVNNHMGSKFTEDEALMKAVLEVVKEKSFFFLDSRTTASSVARRLARRNGVRFATRNVFLDNTRDPRYIRGQIEELIEIARKRGKAVAIGHPYPETIETLRKSIPELRKEGIEVVRLSELVDG